jgi:acetylglutamate/LysW-gamma-L-alpha-aminoadipate kinase
MDVYRTAVAGENAAWVEALQRAGVNAVGLTGLDGRMLRARHKKSVRSVEEGKVRLLHGDHTGVVEAVETGLLQALLAQGVVPVVAPLGISEEGVALNVDGDRVAASLAAALGASALLLLSDVPGLLKDLHDPESLVPFLGIDDREAAMGWAQGRMKKKVLAAFEAVAAGVLEAILADGRANHPLLGASAGRGTVVRSVTP